jgi:hypothetical protein
LVQLPPQTPQVFKSNTTKKEEKDKDFQKSDIEECILKELGFTRNPERHEHAWYGKVLPTLKK